MNHPTISVIIPVYKAQDFIHRCIESVIGQNYKKWEMILIDDGSPDKSGEICDRYAANDSRIKVIHKCNGGVSSARNCGLIHAVGDWVTFIDSDDVIMDVFFDTFLKRLADTDFEIFMGDVEQEDLNGNLFVEYNLPTVCADLKSCISDYKILRSGDLHGKMFKRQIIIGLQLIFEEDIHYSEDQLFFDTYLTKCNKIALDDTICYKYKRNIGGLSYKLNEFDSEYACYRRLFDVLSQIEEITGISVINLMHDSPTKRVLDSSVSDLSVQKFELLYKQLSPIDRLLFSRILKRYTLGCLLNLFFKAKMYFVLYYSLLLYRKIKK